jgi:RimJ/RimL family protein N-acetyltransferase
VISFRPLTADDLPELHRWLQREHVKRWWRDHETLDEVTAHYLPSIQGSEPSDHYVILVDARPAGMVETYLVAEHPEYDALVRAGVGVAGVDILIGEEDLTGRGIGTEVLRQFVDEIVFGRAETFACIAGVEIANTASLRAFAKAGFAPVRDYEEDGRPHRLLRRER